MSLFCRLLRKHYWGTPHRTPDSKLVQVCYECGAERPASTLYNEFAAGRTASTVDSLKAEIERIAAQQLHASGPEVVVVASGQVSGRGFKRALSIIK